MTRGRTWSGLAYCTVRAIACGPNFYSRAPFLSSSILILLWRMWTHLVSHFLPSKKIFQTAARIKQRLKKKFPASCSFEDIEENLSAGEKGEYALPRLEYLNSRVEVVLWCVGNGKRLCGQAGLGPVWEPAPQTPFRRIGHIFWQEYALSILIERKDVLDFYWIEEEVTLNTW